MEPHIVFEAMVQELESRRELRVVEREVGEAPDPRLSAQARRALRFANPELREQLTTLRSLKLQWGLDGGPVLGGLDVPGAEALVARLAVAAERSSENTGDGRNRFVALDSFGHYAVGLVVARGVVGPRLVFRELGGGLLVMPQLLPFDYLRRVFAARALYVLRTLDAGDPALLGPVAHTTWRRDTAFMDDLVALAEALSELAREGGAPWTGGGPPRPAERAAPRRAAGVSVDRPPTRVRCS